MLVGVGCWFFASRGLTGPVMSAEPDLQRPPKVALLDDDDKGFPIDLGQ